MPVPGAETRLGPGSARALCAEVSMRAQGEPRRWTSEDGQDLLEYGLLASLIALFAMAAVGLIGEHMNRFFWTAIGPGI